MGVIRAALVIVAAACSSKAHRPVEDARRVTPAGDAVTSPADATPSVTTPTPRATGDVQIRVVWPNVPAAVRRSPGTTACGTPRAPAVSPSTTWGIGDVFVIVDGGPSSAAEARVRWIDCALQPRLAVGTSLTIDSGAERPTTLVLARRGLVKDLRVGSDADARKIALPIAGHAVTATLEPGAIYRLAPAAKTSEPAWIVAANGAVTDASGVVLMRDVTPGVHAVRAWLPPRAGQPARHAKGEVSVVAGELAELTLQLDS